MEERSTLYALFRCQVLAARAAADGAALAPLHPLLPPALVAPPPSAPSAPGPAAPAAPEDPATSQRVLALLASQGCAFATLAHCATRTCEESAAVRGVEVASGAKAMLLKCAKPLPHGSPYLLAVLSAARKADLRALRGLLGQKSVSLASVEDVRALTGCVPGAVPPFGSLFKGVATYADPSVLDRGHINFNCGLQTLSVLGLPVADYARVERPTRLAFSTE